jgi:hypothetical protein
MTACFFIFLFIAVIMSHEVFALIPSITEHSSFALSLLRRVEPARAQGEFFFFFFGGSGALGIGAAQVPKLLRGLNEIKSLSGGESKGGADLNVSPVATILYPERLKAADIEEVIKKTPKISKIQAATDKRTFMVSNGYLERGGYLKSVKNCNPLASYVVFDALTNGSGDYAAPLEAEMKLETWRQGLRNGDNLSAFSSDLFRANIGKLSAFATFVFLIAIVLDLIIESGINGWL